MDNKIKYLVSCLALACGLTLGAVVAHARSPFQTFAGIGGPLDGRTFSCNAIEPSTTTATSLLSADYTRMALWAINSSTNASSPTVFLTTYAYSPAAGSSDDTIMSNSYGYPLLPSPWDGTPVEGSVFSMTGTSIYQGALYAIANATGGLVNVCTLAP